MAKLSMVTAQRLVDGRVVYLRADRTWTSRDSEAWMSADVEAAEELVAFGRTQTEEVVDVYRIEVEVDETGAIWHLSARERIRAAGPAAILARFGLVPVSRAAVG